MTPAELVQAIEAEVTQRQKTITALQAAAAGIREALGLPADVQICMTLCPPPAKARDRVKAKTRRSVRRGRATAAKALRTTSGRRKAAPPGSLTDRILSTLGDFKAPMKKSAVVDAVKAREADVTAELKRLRADGQVAMVGERSAARWSLPKFANVVVAEESV